MNQSISNIERVRQIKKKVFIKGQSCKKLNNFIRQDAIIDSPINFHQLTGVKGLKTVVSYWKKAFPEVKSEWISVEAKDDDVVVTWKAKGNHTGDDFLCIPAKGAYIFYTGQTMYRFNGDGQLTRYQATLNLDAIKKQLVL